jgi:hypothetical protein
MAIKYAILYLHIILLVLPDTFYLDESGSGFDWIRIRSVLRGRIQIRSKSVQICNTAVRCTVVLDSLCAGLDLLQNPYCGGPC